MRYYLILALSLLFANACFAQFVNKQYISIEPANMVATYTLNYQEDSTNSTQIGSSRLLLFIGHNVSKFENRAGFINDTISRKFTTNQQAIDYLTDPNTPKGKQLYKIYKNYPKGKITYTDHIPSNSYKCEEELNLFDWSIGSDTITICNFKAQKATCEFGGRSWIAWFAPEIPFSDGPYKFNGLPGLIVKVHDTRNHYVFELTAINKLEPPLMIEMQDKSYIKTTKQGFFRAWDSFREDIISRAKEAGMDNQAQQVMAKNMEKLNNPIELKRK